MKVLGLDVGSKTIGVAVSDALGWTAQGVETIRRDERDLEKDFARLKEIMLEHEISTVVVGMPKNMNGTIGPSGEMCQEFASQLQERADVKIEFVDERLTTVAAERMLVSADVSRKKRKKVIDKMAAVLILQGYLDRNQK
ncbi:Holliday junction resolvase RuvX [Evansella sp. AB-rgal1]|uniref:Holliday junction resolvase RuvX n=1 Tax=Evansella sp. AB-rgal1 TaxID=3242696 RepID=UPI00359D670C